MNAMDLLRIAPFINDCPKCGNGVVGGGEGTLGVNDDIVTRTCKCGFQFIYNVTNGTSKIKIRRAIKEALEKSGGNHVVQ